MALNSHALTGCQCSALSRVFCGWSIWTISCDCLRTCSNSTVWRTPGFNVGLSKFSKSLMCIRCARFRRKLVRMGRTWYSSSITTSKMHHPDTTASHLTLPPSSYTSPLLSQSNTSPISPPPHLHIFPCAFHSDTLPGIQSPNGPIIS